MLIAGLLESPAVPFPSRVRAVAIDTSVALAATAGRFLPPTENSSSSLVRPGPQQRLTLLVSQQLGGGTDGPDERHPPVDA